MESQLDDSSNRPLCVDMDGTLLLTDVLHEAVWRYLRLNPFRIFLVIRWILQGRSVFKDEIFARVSLPVATLPSNEILVEFVERESNRGRLIVLATASPAVIAQQVAKRFSFIDEVLATDRSTNLKGEQKARALIERFGEHAYDYVGDSIADIPVWNSSHTAHTVGANQFKRLSKEVTRGQEFPASTKRAWLEFTRCIRVHQWVKNLLIFIPPIMAHTLLIPEVFGEAFRAFMAFSFAASGVYVLNDLVDIDSDRAHKSKRNRPFASGGLPLWSGFIFLPLLLLASFLSAPKTMGFLSVLLGYLILTTCYSFLLKQVVLLDIFTLATLYTVRIFAGSVATDTLISPWLLAFSVFIFLSLACVKRASEILNLKKSSTVNSAHLVGRGYTVSDYEQISRFGSTAGYLAVLIMALYINSPDVSMFYSREYMLWFLCPLVLYWISRVWLLTSREQLHEDPIVFALRDSVSYLVAILSAGVLLLAL